MDDRRRTTAWLLTGAATVAVLAVGGYQITGGGDRAQSVAVVSDQPTLEELEAQESAMFGDTPEQKRMLFIAELARRPGAELPTGWYELACARADEWNEGGLGSPLAPLFLPVAQKPAPHVVLITRAEAVRLNPEHPHGNGYACGQGVIALVEGAPLDTLLHELVHYWGHEDEALAEAFRLWARERGVIAGPPGREYCTRP